MKKEELLFLNQLVTSLEKAGEKLEESSKKNNFGKLNHSKKIMFKLQKEILQKIK